ncbi:MAG: choice-of-anchor H family protein [Woeseiaceae bacterium]|nr:choice-of-anchor H family protein [Woeseiaceae bacterium]
MKTTTTHPFARMAAAMIATLLASTSFAAENSGNAELRVSESSYFSDDGRKQKTANRISTDTFEPGTRIGRRSLKAAGNDAQKAGPGGESRTPNTDFWFYTADVELFGDEDRDGYFHGIDLLFDADTVYNVADVYAVVYLSEEGGPWFEYAETETFTIFGASSDDEYVIVSELLAGYPRASYDILIELFDTWDNSFVADFGPENTSELAFLPLEDAERDTPVTAPDVVVVSRGGGGAVDIWTITALALMSAGLLLRRRYRSQPATLRR